MLKKQLGELKIAAVCSQLHKMTHRFRSWSKTLVIITHHTVNEVWCWVVLLQTVQVSSVCICPRFHCPQLSKLLQKCLLTKRKALYFGERQEWKSTSCRVETTWSAIGQHKPLSRISHNCGHEGEIHRNIHYCSGFWFDKYHLQLIDDLWHRAKQLFSHVQVGTRETRRFPSRCRCLACSSAESMWQRILRSRRPLGTAMHANSARARTHNYACICARADASVRAHLARRWMCLLTRTQQEQHIVWTRSRSLPRKAGDVHKWAV